MKTADVLIDAFDRIREVVRHTVGGLTPEQLTLRVDPQANSIAWLVWHLTRVQDDHVAGVAELEQVWISGDWTQRFALPFDARAHGYGHRSEDVAAVRASGELLIAYYDAVHEQTVKYVGTLTDADLDRIVDRAWDPPVTLGVRLVSVISDDLQHIGQAAFIRGIAERQR